MSGRAWLAVLAAGALGAPLRYVVDGAVSARTGGTFPWGTLVVNASGSLVLGALAGLVTFHATGETARLVLGTGFCGAYTTFSTFTYETVRLAEDGETGRAGLNVAAQLVAGPAAAAAGLGLAWAAGTLAGL